MSWKVYCNTHHNRLGSFQNKPDAIQCRNNYLVNNPQCDVSLIGQQSWQLHQIHGQVNLMEDNLQSNSVASSALIGIYPSKTAALKSLKQLEKVTPTVKIALLKLH